MESNSSGLDGKKPTWDTIAGKRLDDPGARCLKSRAGKKPPSRLLHPPALASGYFVGHPQAGTRPRSLAVVATRRSNAPAAKQRRHSPCTFLFATCFSLGPASRHLPHKGWPTFEPPAFNKRPARGIAEGGRVGIRHPRSVCLSSWRGAGKFSAGRAFDSVRSSSCRR